MTESAQPTFEALYSDHAPLVRRLLRERGVTASDLDDVVQETFATVHRLLPSFEGRSSLTTWLHAVTWRIAANHRRRQRRTLVGGPLDVAAKPIDIEQTFERTQLPLENIDGEQRDLLALREIGGLSITWISELTGYARATVRNKLQRGRAALLRASAQRRHRAEAFDRALAARFAAATPIARAPELHVLDCGLTAVSTVDDLVLALWRGPCTHQGLQQVIGTLCTHARQHQGGIRYLSVIEPPSTPPDREGRDMMLWAARELKGSLTAVAHVVESSAHLTVIASIMNASILLARAGFDPHYFGELQPALTWLAQHGSMDSQRIAKQIARMKNGLAPPPVAKSNTQRSAR